MVARDPNSPLTGLLYAGRIRWYGRREQLEVLVGVPRAWTG